MIERRLTWQFAVFTFVLALALTVMPLPASVAPYRPEWVPLILIFYSTIFLCLTVPAFAYHGRKYFVARMC